MHEVCLNVELGPMCLYARGSEAHIALRSINNIALNLPFITAALKAVQVSSAAERGVMLHWP